MKRLALAVSLALAFVAGCDDDSDGGGRTDGGDGGGGDVAPLDAARAMCTGTFAGLTRVQLGAATSASGMCRAGTDLDYICVADIAAMARGCGTTCVMLGLTGQPLLTCVDQCLGSSRMLTAGCASCYSQLLACTLQNCNAECTADPNSNACRTCQTTRGCMGAFFTCSGLPGGTPSDGGTDGPRPDATPDAVDAGSDVRDAPIETGGGDVGGDARVDAADAGADAADAADATAG